MAVVVTPADISDRAGALHLLTARLRRRFPRLERILVDQGYAGRDFEARVLEERGLELDVVTRPPGRFQIQPGRWIVERTFAWLTFTRRLVRDYDPLPATTESWIWLNATRILLRRLAP